MNNLIMVRDDKIMSDLENAEPNSRWDPHFWDSKFENIFKDINLPTKKLNTFMLPEVEGIRYGSTGKREWSENAGEGVKYIKSANVRETGLDLPNIHWTPEGSSLDGSQYRVKKGDIIMNKSGTGTLGRLFVIDRDFGKMVVSQDTMRIRVEEISPYYVVTFLQSKFGTLQVKRYATGVSGQTHINFDDIRSFKIPVLPEDKQEEIKEGYLEMSEIHYEAMELKKGNKQKSKEKLEMAKERLLELIDKTEQIIKYYE